MKQLLAIIIFGIALSGSNYAQITNIVILDQAEVERLRNLVQTDPRVTHLADSITSLANMALDRKPRPLEIVHYEGLLENNPDRIDTKKSFEDINATVHLIYASYLTDQIRYAEKAIEFAEKAIELDSNNPGAYYNIAVAHYKLKRNKKAKKILKNKEVIRLFNRN